MVHNPHPPLTDHDTDSGAPTPPTMLHQPVDAPDIPSYAADIESVRVFRQVWRHRRELSAAPRHGSLRTWAGRVTGRSDRRLISALASATDAVADHCDQLVNRLTSQEAKTADMARTFGEELAQLRAEVDHLRNVVTSLQPPQNG